MTVPITAALRTSASSGPGRRERRDSIRMSSQGPPCSPRLPSAIEWHNSSMNNALPPDELRTSAIRRDRRRKQARHGLGRFTGAERRQGQDIEIADPAAPPGRGEQREQRPFQIAQRCEHLPAGVVGKMPIVDEQDQRTMRAQPSSIASIRLPHPAENWARRRWIGRSAEKAATARPQPRIRRDGRGSRARRRSGAAPRQGGSCRRRPVPRSRRSGAGRQRVFKGMRASRARPRGR